MKVSIIIPVYNEERTIRSCLASLSRQTVKDSEIIVIDDGSTDNSKFEIQNFRSKNLRYYEQSHLGPGAARNLGASKANGEILVFVDADMEFEPDFVQKLVGPIVSGTAIGTFSKDEYLLNKDSVYARCWNLNLGRRAEKMHPDDYPNTQHVFRAILKKKFDEVSGFDPGVGYTDDWSLARKLGVLAVAAPGAKLYHRNPANLKEVWVQARWFGKNEFLTRNFVRKLYNLLRYNPLTGIGKGIYGAVRFREPDFLVFKIFYDTAVFVSVCRSIFREQKAK